VPEDIDIKRLLPLWIEERDRSKWDDFVGAEKVRAKF